MARMLKRGRLPAEIIQVLGDDFERILTGALQPSKALKYGAGRVSSEYFPKKKSGDIERALKRLKERKLIKQKGLEFTHDGWIAYLELKVEQADLLNEDRMLMIIFDIPETRRSARNKLRKLLRRSGCILVQRSIFVTPFDIAKPLGRVLIATGLDRCVRFYYAEHAPISDDRHFMASNPE